MNKTKNKLEISLLKAWEETYKKGQLSFWIFLSLKDSHKYVTEIKSFIEKYSIGTITCEEQSLYRTLRKFQHLEMVKFYTKKGNKGPDRKYYEITPLGKKIFKRFIERNILILFDEKIKTLIQ